MDITLDLSLLIGLLSLPVVIPLLMQHTKRFDAWVRHEPKGSPWPLAATLTAVVWVHALHQAGVLAGELGEHSLNLWAVTLVGFAMGAITPLGYDGWRRLRPGAAPPH